MAASDLRRSGVPSPAMRTISTLDQDEAARAVEAVRVALASEKKNAVIAVADAHGDLLMLLRIDGAPAASITIATNKAWTAATQGVATRTIGARLRSEAEAFDIAYYGDPRACGWGGGLPVVDRGGSVLGAVAVSGLPELEDERFAAIGKAAIEESLAASP
jgi:glc operon protein GlcG